jgi:hypothetical protein
MKHLQTYRIFESSTTLTEEQKKFLEWFVDGVWSLNPQTGRVDVDGGCSCTDPNEELDDLSGIQFGDVSGDFTIINQRITDLKGAPRTVGGNFECHSNKLTSLEGAPETVAGAFSCYGNLLTDLKGAPRTVGRNFYCNSNRLTSLEGAPETVGGFFNCNWNSLTSLEGAPQKVERNFYCTVNKLTSLEGAPQIVEGSFYCDEFSTKNWTPEGKLEILKTGTEAAKTLIATAISPETLQKQIDGNPVRMAVSLKGVWKTLKGMPGYEKLKFPPEHSEEAEMLSDLDDIGL